MMTGRIGRRGILGGGLALAGLPALARHARAATTLTFIPQTDVTGLDPIWSTQTAVRNHGYMVFDTLFCSDAQLRIRPQMAEGLATSSDGLGAEIRLREGLRWHDGAPVLARDCVASIRRWASRDQTGMRLMAATEALSAPDDRTIRFRLKQPFPELAYALGKLSTPVPFMMPERLAQVPSTQQIPQAIGSGPFRFVQGEWVQGSRLVYERFAGYVPRDEPPSGMAGGKRVNVDRVVWTVVPDANTAMSALQAGNVDWLEYPSQDLLPLVKGNPAIRVDMIDALGFTTVGRMNQAQPPFNNPKVRQAFATAIDQQQFMQAALGDDASLYRTCRAFLPCGSPWAHEALTQMQGDVGKARAMLAASGYDGSKAVILAPGDNPIISACCQVAYDLMRRIGMKAELASMDVATMIRARVSRDPPDKGGWSFFVTFSGSLGSTNPVDSLWLQATGDAAPPGWPDDAQLQAMLVAFSAATSDEARGRLSGQIERRAADSLPYVPLGQFQQPTAYRSSVSDVLPAGAAVFWNLRKA